MKRSQKLPSIGESTGDINDEFLRECKEEFDSNPTNTIVRNSVVSIGSMISTTNSDRLNDISYVFLNTLKKKNVKATNQGRSGRCWLFAGLNLFRHNVIKALDLENFEFSEIYLFFWDKMERANSYLKWFLDHPEIKTTDKAFIFMVEEYTSDGGWWSNFANLVAKYGLVPKCAMGETWQSEDSDDMNSILDERLKACASYIINNRYRHSEDELLEIKDETLKQVYTILVKFLGEPPKKFKWCYTNDDNESNIIDYLSPEKFMNMVIPWINIQDFVVLVNMPTDLKYRKTYSVKYTNNVAEGNSFTFLNLPINELSKYAKKSIISGMPVWFGADVSQDFNPYHSTLDDKLSDSDIVFGDSHPFSKGDKIKFRNLQANHAMTLIGINLKHDGTPDSWQVENSWGFWDNETPGEDGFLYMSHSWFKKNVLQVVIHKNYLSRTVQRLLLQDPILLDPWDCVAPALRIKPIDAPRNYIRMLKKPTFPSF